jgi:hypothetical protein
VRRGSQLAGLAILIGALITGIAASEGSDAPGKPEAKPKREYKPPPGYRTRTRGDKVVYCKKVSIPESRLMTEKCYDEIRLREIESLMEQQRREIDQRRRILPILT